MRNTILISIILLLFLCSCRKNPTGAGPSLKFKSVNTTVLRNFDIIQFTLSFTQKDNAISDSIIVMKRTPKCAVGDFSAPYKIPTFPSTKNLSGDIVVSLPYTDVSPKCPNNNDTSVFKFVLLDVAKKTSDTVVSPQIIIVY